jgi:hypothetical protein
LTELRTLSTGVTTSRYAHAIDPSADAAR